MKLALPVHVGRISTVLDFAHQLLVVEVDDSHEIRRSEIAFKEDSPRNQASRLAHLDIEVLICGAISHPLATLIAAAGVEIIPFVSGPVEEVVACFISGQLAASDYLLPGCTPESRREWKSHHPPGPTTGRGKSPQRRRRIPRST